MAFYLGSNKIASGGSGTTGTASETSITDLKLNYLTEEQYNTAKANGQINEDELYFTPDDETIIPNDYIVERGKQDDWEYVKWNSGKAEAYGNFYYGNIQLPNQAGIQYYGNEIIRTLPSGLFTSVDCYAISQGRGSHSSGVFPYGLGTFEIDKIGILFRAFSKQTAGHCAAFVHVYGNWK